MRTISLIATAVMVSAPAWVRIASAQAPQPATVAAPAAATAISTPTTTVPPVIAEEADRLLRQMGEYIGSAEQFTFHADITFDHLLPSGQKLQWWSRNRLRPMNARAITLNPRAIFPTR
jgi:hypothetical protein